MSKSKEMIKSNLETLHTTKIYDDCQFKDLLAYCLDVETHIFCIKHGLPTATYDQIIDRLIELLGE